MKNQSLARSAVFMLILVTLLLGGCEIYLRHQGVNISYDDGPALWAAKRAEVYAPKEKAVVFIGSSRIKYDLDIPTWETLTGLKATQLSIVGSNPRPMLEDLANDPEFKGRLVIDVTEPLFFSGTPQYSENPNKNIKYFHDRTLAQQASLALSNVLESGLVFLDKDNLSMNAKLDGLEIPSRQGVFMMPLFPMEFNRTAADRQSYMTSRFVKDNSQVNQVRAVWQKLCGGPKGPPMTDAQIEAVVKSVKAAVDKIRARGGEVIFVRTPSSGPFLQGETMGFPRAKYWDRLLAVTGCQGIHFADYAATSHFSCPEFSHLCKPDAVLFTREIVKILESKGWSFPASVKSLKL